MKLDQRLEDPVSLKIWSQYFRRISRILWPMDPEQREDLTLEIQTHVLESMAQEKEGGEPERLLNALEKLGEPEQFLRPLMADKMLGKAARTLSPGAVLKGLYLAVYKGVRVALFSLLFVIGYAAALTFGMVALLKPIIPRHAGIFFSPEGGLAAGILGGNTQGYRDILGYWVIPISLMLAVLLYVGLTKLLRLLRSPRG